MLIHLEDMNLISITTNFSFNVSSNIPFLLVWLNLFRKIEKQNVITKSNNLETTNSRNWEKQIHVRSCLIHLKNKVIRNCFSKLHHGYELYIPVDMYMDYIVKCIYKRLIFSSLVIMHLCYVCEL